MKRGDLYSFQIQSGLTRTGTIVWVDKEGITVIYKAEENKRTRRIPKKEIIKKNIVEVKC